MNFKLFLILLLAIGQLPISTRAEKGSLKLNIREIPLNPFNTSDILEIGLMLFIIDLEPFKELEQDYRIDYLVKQIWWPHSNCKFMQIIQI